MSSYSSDIFDPQQQPEDELLSEFGLELAFDLDFSLENLD